MSISYLMFGLFAVDLFLLFDVIGAYPHDLYGIVMGQFFTIPLAVVTIFATYYLHSRLKKIKFPMALGGYALGLLMAVLPITLFLLGRGG